MLKDLFPKDVEVVGQKLNYNSFFFFKHPKVTDLLNFVT